MKYSSWNMDFILVTSMVINSCRSFERTNIYANICKTFKLKFFYMLKLQTRRQLENVRVYPAVEINTNRNYSQR
jgi:hypothetical protein